MLYFGNSITFKQEMMRVMDSGGPHLLFLIIDASGISNIDFVGLKTLDEIKRVAEERGVSVLLANVRGMVKKKVCSRQEVRGRGGEGGREKRGRGGANPYPNPNPNPNVKQSGRGEKGREGRRRTRNDKNK